MASFQPELNDVFRRFIGEQKVFFVATAAPTGRVNVSPKGMDTLRVVDARTVAYLDLTGSGNETAAHVENDGRLTMMFCSFDDKPLILRLYGRGRCVRRRDPDWGEWLARFPARPGSRQVIVLQIESAQSSCGWGVPLLAFQGERETLAEVIAERGEAYIERHWREHNRVSIDGLPTRLLEDD